MLTGELWKMKSTHLKVTKYQKHWLNVSHDFPQMGPFINQDSKVSYQDLGEFTFPLFNGWWVSADFKEPLIVYKLKLLYGSSDTLKNQ